MASSNILGKRKTLKERWNLLSWIKAVINIVWLDLESSIEKICNTHTPAAVKQLPEAPDQQGAAGAGEGGDWPDPAQRGLLPADAALLWEPRHPHDSPVCGYWGHQAGDRYFHTSILHEFIICVTNNICSPACLNFYNDIYWYQQNNKLTWYLNCINFHRPYFILFGCESSLNKL